MSAYLILLNDRIKTSGDFVFANEASIKISQFSLLASNARIISLMLLLFAVVYIIFFPTNFIFIDVYFSDKIDSKSAINSEFFIL